MSRNEPAIFDAKDPASPLSVTVSQTALLLMDYHNFVISRGGDQAADALLKANFMREWALANGALVVHCLVDMKQRVLPSFKSASRIKLMASAMEAQPGVTAEHPDIAFRSGPGEHIFTRAPGYYSALHSRLESPDLRSLLSTRGIRSLLLCGISTSGCVLSTARAAADEGFIVTVIEDACMDPVPGLHETLVRNVLPSQVHIATAEVFQEQWDKAKDGLSLWLSYTEGNVEPSD